MPGLFRGERTLVVTREITGLKSTANLAYMQKATLLCPKKCIFGFASAQGTLLLNGRKITKNEIFILRANIPYDMVISKHLSLFTFAINDIDSNISKNDETMNTLLREHEPLLTNNKLSVRTITQPHLRDLLVKKFNESEDPNAQSLLELTKRILSSSTDSVYRPNSRNNLLLRTLRLMQAQPFTYRKISDVALACHISQRGLEKAFEDVLTGSPGEYLKAIQLNRYRAAIIQNAGNDKLSLADIAAQLGAVNYSRLSKDYKSFFEELPSNTRKNIET